MSTKSEIQNNLEGCKWADDFSEYIKVMTRGHGYGGEEYWDEEESWIADYFSNKEIKRSLSVGCGLFREFETLSQITSEEVVGLDFEQKFVDYLQENIEFTEPKASFLQGDAMKMSFAESEKFDLVVSLFVSIGILPNIAEAISSMYSAKKDGGYLLISVWNDSDEINDFRKKIYNSSGKNSVYITTNEIKKLEDITVERDGKVIHKSPIITKQYLTDLINQTSPNSEIEVFDNHYSRIFLIR